MTAAQISSDLFYSKALNAGGRALFCPPLVRCHAIRMTYRGTVSTLGTLMCLFSPSPSLSPALPPLRLMEVM